MQAEAPLVERALGVDEIRQHLSAYTVARRRYEIGLRVEF